MCAKYHTNSGSNYSHYVRVKNFPDECRINLFREECRIKIFRKLSLLSFATWSSSYVIQIENVYVHIIL